MTTSSSSPARTLAPQVCKRLCLPWSGMGSLQGRSGDSRLDLESNILSVGLTLEKKRGQDLGGPRWPWNLRSVAREYSPLWWPLPQSFLELLFEAPSCLKTSETLGMILLTPDCEHLGRLYGCRKGSPCSMPPHGSWNSSASGFFQVATGENVIFTVFHLPAAHWVEGCVDNCKHLYTCSFDHSSHMGKLRHRVVKRLACASYRQATHQGHTGSLDLLFRAFRVFYSFSGRNELASLTTQGLLCLNHQVQSVYRLI